MIPDEQIDTVIFAVLPQSIRVTMKKARDYADTYIKAHGLSWESAYDTSRIAFMRQEERIAANDTTNEVPYPQVLLAQAFGGDKEMATAMYWLALFHSRAENILVSLLEQQTAHLEAPGEAPPPRDGKVVHENVAAHRRSLQGYAKLLQAMDVRPMAAKQNAQQLEAALSEAFVYQRGRR